MTWKNHRITALALAYAATGGIVFSFFAALSSTLPDRFAGNVENHRTITHFWLVPVAAMVFLITISRQADIKPYSILLAAIFGYSAHIFTDALSKGGIPVFGPWGEKYGLGLYITGTSSETLSTVGLVLISICLAMNKGYFSIIHLLDQPLVGHPIYLIIERVKCIF